MTLTEFLKKTYGEKLEFLPEGITLAQLTCAIASNVRWSGELFELSEILHKITQK